MSAKKRKRTRPKPRQPSPKKPKATKARRPKTYRQDSAGRYRDPSGRFVSATKVRRSEAARDAWDRRREREAIREEPRVVEKPDVWERFTEPPAELGEPFAERADRHPRVRENLERTRVAILDEQIRRLQEERAATLARIELPPVATTEEDLIRERLARTRTNAEFEAEARRIAAESGRQTREIFTLFFSPTAA